MGNNVPLGPSDLRIQIFGDWLSLLFAADYLGYDHTNTNLTYSQMQAIANRTILSHAPCYNKSSDSATTAADCLHTIIRLAYLNQQSDSGTVYWSS